MSAINETQARKRALYRELCRRVDSLGLMLQGKHTDTEDLFDALLFMHRNLDEINAVVLELEGAYDS